MYSAKNTESIKGNSQLFRVHGIKTLKRKHPEVLRLLQDGLLPVEFGSRIWRASYLLIDYLSKQALSSQQHVLELGCGWGLPSIYAKKQFGMQVTSTDADCNVFAYQKLISTINDADIIQKRSSFTELSSQNLRGYDVLMGADICYSPAHAKSLEELFHHYLAQRDGRIVLADSGRTPFFHLVERLSHSYDIELEEVRIDLPVRGSGHVLSLRGKQ